MGDTSRFLVQNYDWYTDSDGKVSCPIFQQAFVEQIIERFKLKHCKSARIPYQLGLKFDQIDHDDLPKFEKEDFIKEYQTIFGCLNWLSIKTRPNIITACSLLSQFNSNPLAGHMESANFKIIKTCCVAWYLVQTKRKEIEGLLCYI